MKDHVGQGVSTRVDSVVPATWIGRTFERAKAPPRLQREYHAVGRGAGAIRGRGRQGRSAANATAADGQIPAAVLDDAGLTAPTAGRP